MSEYLSEIFMLEIILGESTILESHSPLEVLDGASFYGGIEYWLSQLSAGLIDFFTFNVSMPKDFF